MVMARLKGVCGNNFPRPILKKRGKIYWLHYADVDGCRHRVSLKTRDEKTAKLEQATHHAGLKAAYYHKRFGKHMPTEAIVSLAILDVPDHMARRAAKRARGAIEKKITLGEIFKNYKETTKLRSESLQKSVKYHLDAAEEFFGRDLGADDLDDAKLRKYLNFRKEKGASDETLRSFLRCLKAAFNYGVRTRAITGVPFVAPKIKRTKKELTAREGDAVKLLEALDLSKDLHRATALILFTGMRRDEALTAKWEDIDFGTGVITYRRSKNKDSLIVPLKKSHLEALSKIKGKGPIYTLSPKTFSAGLVRLTTKVLGKNIGSHQWRHLFNTTLQKLGVPQTVVNELIGHSNEGRQVEDIYTHWSIEDKQEKAMEKLPW